MMYAAAGPPQVAPPVYISGPPTTAEPVYLTAPAPAMTIAAPQTVTYQAPPTMYSSGAAVPMEPVATMIPGGGYAAAPTVYSAPQTRQVQQGGDLFDQLDQNHDGVIS